MQSPHAARVVGQTRHAHPGESGGVAAVAARLRPVLGRRDLLAFFPLLGIYLALVLRGDPEPPRYDELDYLALAANLTRGTYASPGAAADLWWGPGYPLVLSPLIALHAPLALLRGLDVVFMFVAVLYLYATLRQYAPAALAVTASYFLGLHPALLGQFPLLMSESLAVLLVCASTFYFCRYCRATPGRTGRTGTLLAAAFCLSLLALTKVLFGYVLTLQVALYGVLCLWKRVPAVRRPLLVYALSLALCSPWLLYTYAVSGRAFYWASSGGMSLYWMSSPFPDEFGDWHSEREVFETPNLARHHGAFFRELEGLSRFERDDALRTRAISNIAANPTKFADNILSNIGRMLFGSPYTNKRQSTDYLQYLVPNAVVAALAAFCAVPTYLCRLRLPSEVVGLLVFAGSAFAASCLVSAYGRQFAVLLPPLGVWLVFTLSQLVRIEIRRA